MAWTSVCIRVIIFSNFYEYTNAYIVNSITIAVRFWNILSYFYNYNKEKGKWFYKSLYWISKEKCLTTWKYLRIKEDIGRQRTSRISQPWSFSIVVSTSNSHLRETRRDSRKFFGELQKGLWRVVYRLGSLAFERVKLQKRRRIPSHSRSFTSSFSFFVVLSHANHNFISILLRVLIFF